MKKYILLLVAASILASCDDYLDVKPKSQVEKDVLFSTQEGFQEALNGVYTRGIETNIYGDELTFGFLDILAQNYNINPQNSLSYLEMMKFNYEDSWSIYRKDIVWSGLYAAIAHSNLILENVDEKKHVFLSEANYNIVKGETLALRAYFHLDALRIFGYSMASSNKDKPVIPYVTGYTNKVTKQGTTAEILDLIIADLTAAKELLAESDPILSAGYIVGYPVDGPDGDNLPDDGSTEESASTLFLQNRRHRMNYYAVCGALARAYLWLDNKELALENALLVINANKFPWTKATDFAAPEDANKDRILYKELLFGWYVPTRYKEINNRFNHGATGMYTNVAVANAIYETAGPGGEDLRYKQWFKTVAESGVTMQLLQKYTYDQDGDNRHYLMAPAIRLSEMYYIASECSFDQDIETAWGYFNTVRFNRGIGGAYEKHGAVSKDDFLKELAKEARKEFFGEGQIFYMYKRLNLNIPDQTGNEISGNDDIFVLPLPNDEITFGGRN